MNTTPCGPLKVNRLFGGICRLHLPGEIISQTSNERESVTSIVFFTWLILRPWRWRRHIPPKRRFNLNELHSFIYRKIEFFISPVIPHADYVSVKSFLCLINRYTMKSCEGGDTYPFILSHQMARGQFYASPLEPLSFSLWLYSPLELGRFFSFLILYTVSRTPRTGDQPVARPLPTHRKIIPSSHWMWGWVDAVKDLRQMSPVLLGKGSSLCWKCADIHWVPSPPV
jgi:hypothetical protein